ncbi:MAG: hypothetical protein Q4C47_09140 [Planctomycetia bacterium]|nr:hypothetical protein [Planctomycetia bacterium]
MSRDNQGLQIGLIVTAILTIILGTTTFLGFRWYGDQLKVAEEAKQAESTAKQAESAAKSEAASWRALCFGPADSQPQTVGECETRLRQELQLYFAGQPAVNSYYAAFLESQRLLQQKSQEYDGVMASYAKLDESYKNEVEALKANLATAQAEVDRASQKLAQKGAEYDDQATEAAAQNRTLAARLDADRRASEDRLKVADSERTTALQTADRNRRIAEDRQRKIRHLEDPTFEVALGKVEYVRQDRNMVWISLGSDDKLPLLTTFAVYDSDATDVSGAPKKASIEITDILGPHLAQGNILEGASTNPIIPGDLIHTPLWTPGLQKHFAMAGLIDLDGDGQDDRETLRSLIEASGGVVDADVTENTTSLIMGQLPDEGSAIEDIQAYTKAKEDAERLLVTMVPLEEFIPRTGYRPGIRLYRVGAGDGVDPWRPLERMDRKPSTANNNVSPLYQEPDRKPATANGSVSPLYQGRQAPVPQELTSY